MDLLYETFSELRYKTGILGPYLDKMDLNKFGMRLDDIEKMVYSANAVLKQMGGLGVFDKQMESTLKYVSNRIEFLFNEIMVYEDQGINNTESYLRKLAKDVVQELPVIPNPDMEGRNLVTKTKVISMEKQQAEEEMIEMLLSEDFDIDTALVSVVSILGMAYTGGNSLAHHIILDQRVQDHFDIKLWIDISRAKTRVNIVRQVIGKAAFTAHSFNIEWLVSLLQSKLRGKKFLLVLENLSEDNGDLLEPLLYAFSKCKQGSKILATSKSTSITPHVVLRLPMARNPLGSPNKKECISLFQSIAFRGIVERDINYQMLHIGFRICKKCSYNLQVITIIASILSCQPCVQKWQYFYDSLLTSVTDPVTFIMSAVHRTLKPLAYLGPVLYYSSLFPKDYSFSRLELLQLWEVQGFLNLSPSKRMFDAYFTKALADGNFVVENNQKKRDKTGVVCYKVHGLIHHVVVNLLRDDYCFLDKATNEVVGNRVQHVSFMVDASWEAPSWLQDANQLKTLLFLPRRSHGSISIPNFDVILANMKALQVLDLAVVDYRNSHDSLREMKQLRYLRLGKSFDSLPACITNLKFLRTLDLTHTSIRLLPEGFHRLRCLRHLYTGCRLIDLPPEFEALKKLQTLDEFIVGKNNGLYELNKLTKLAGKLKIRYQNGRKIEFCKSDIIANRNLHDLSLVWLSSTEVEHSNVHDKKSEAVQFEFLQPPSTLESLKIQGWKGVNFPPWPTDKFSVILNNIVSIHIVDCNNCQHLPDFSTLYNLESLQLWGLNALEWVEHCDSFGNAYYHVPYYFPSLKYLMLANLSRLKGWSKAVDYEQQGKHDVQQYQLKCISELRITDCPKLMSMPQVPSLEKLEVVNIHVKLLNKLMNSQQLKVLKINSVHDLESFESAISSLQVLCIRSCTQLKNVVAKYCNTLKQLKIQACPRLKDVLQTLHNLSFLEELEIESCEALDWAHMKDDIEDSRAAWDGLKNLRSLTLKNLSKPEPLPRGLTHLTALKELRISWLYNMSVLPQWIGHLTRLNLLAIHYCPKLKEIPDLFYQIQVEIKNCPKLHRRNHGQTSHFSFDAST